MPTIRVLESTVHTLCNYPIFGGNEIPQKHTTVNPAYSNHSRDVVIVVSVHRWTLYRGAFSTAEVDNEPAYHGHYRQKVFICEWSLRQVLLYWQNLWNVVPQKFTAIHENIFLGLHQNIVGENIRK